MASVGFLASRWRCLRWRAAALGAGLFACALGGQIPLASQADADRAAATRPATTLAELEQGRALYLKRCSACHQPVAPASVPPQDWPGHVTNMKARAHLQPDEEQLVLLYLTTMASAPARGNAAR